MIAIVDGGSTKCDWVILENSGKFNLKITTLGFNPNIINLDIVPQEINRNEELFFLRNHIEKLFFYCSGCGRPHNAKKVEQEVKAMFPNAEVSIKEDMTAAAYAAYNDVPAIICILGTGSNSCIFDGEKIRTDLTSLGFLIGDEGSGSALGKHLLRRFFMKKLPADLEAEFIKTYNLTI